MNEEVKQKLRNAGRQDLIDIHDINQSGYAGILSNGNIVDRRKFPMAIPVLKNDLLGIPESKPFFEPSTKEEYNRRVNDKALYVVGAMFMAMISKKDTYILDNDTMNFYKVDNELIKTLYYSIALLNDMGFTVFKGYTDKSLNTAEYHSLDDKAAKLLCGPMEFTFDELKKIFDIIKMLGS